jgi:hypothetical protein
MSTAETIFEKAKALPDNRQVEALNFVNFLIAQELVRNETTEWAAASGAQLSRQYGDEDAIYDQVES